MSIVEQITISVAGIVIRFVFPSKTRILQGIDEFRCDTEQIDIQYKIQLLEKPLEIETVKSFSFGGIDFYQTKLGQLRVYPSLIEENGCQVACLISDTGENILYYPAEKWEYYAEDLHFLHLIGIEEILIHQDAFLLHSSLIQYRGYTILFSGPSGIGKSTQACQWKKHLGADILNGDRCLIRKKNTEFLGYGSPWCGTSRIYRKEGAPIKGIFILKKAHENSVRRLKAEAFSKIQQQTTVNSWNSEFMEKSIELIIELVTKVPVYELSCRPDEEAVMLAYKTLFEGDI